MACVVNLCVFNQSCLKEGIKKHVTQAPPPLSLLARNEQCPINNTNDLLSYLKKIF